MKYKLYPKEQTMALDKFKEHIAQDEEVKSEEVVAEETTTEEEFDQIVASEEAVAEAKKATKESEEMDSEDEKEMEESKKAAKESEEMDDEEGEEMEEAKSVKTESDDGDMDDEEEMDETANMTKSEILAASWKMLKNSNKENLSAGYKALKASFDVVVDGEDEAEKSVKEQTNEDVEAMFSGQELSEEFKTKATTIFEAAINAKAAEAIAEVEKAKEIAIAEGVEKVKEELTEKVDTYLDYVVEQWMKDNEIAIEKGLKAELVEDFLGGLKNLFMEHYIDVPEEKVDVLEEQATEIEQLKAKLNEQIEAAVEQKQVLDTFVAREILASVSEGLADTEAEKVAKLAEGVEFVDADQYREKLETIKESYFPKVKATGGNPEDSVSEVQQMPSGDMAAYTLALSRMKK